MDVKKSTPFAWNGTELRALEVDSSGDLEVVATPASGTAPTRSLLDLSKIALFGYDPINDVWRALEVDTDGALKVA